MKEAYQNAEMDLVTFSAEDVISTSAALEIPTFNDLYDDPNARD